MLSSLTINPYYGKLPLDFEEIAIGIDIGTLKSGISIAVSEKDKKYCLARLIEVKCPKIIQIEDRMELISIYFYKVMRDFVNPKLRMYNVHIGIEQPPPPKEFNGAAYPTIALYGMMYVLRNRIRKLMHEPNNLKIDISMINNLQWKLNLVGKGDATKKEIQEAAVKLDPVFKRFWEKYKSQDVMDSIGILKYMIEQELIGSFGGSYAKIFKSD